MLGARWDAETWPRLRAEFKKALALRSHIRRGRRLTQREVAEGAKVAKNYITMLETGWRKSCSLSVLQRIAKGARGATSGAAEVVTPVRRPRTI
jgi:predicted transcriptional regulator